MKNKIKIVIKKQEILAFIVVFAISMFAMGCNASQYGRFEKISDMNVTRSSLGNPKLFLLKNGRVLIFGGDTYNVPYGKHGTRYEINKNVSAEIFDPKTNTFTLKKGLNHGLNNFSATLLNNGKVLITGGYVDSYEGSGFGSRGPVHNTSELYNPETDSVTKGPDMTSPRDNHTAVLLKDGRVLIFGGLTGKRGKEANNNTAEIYDPVENKFTLLKSFPNFNYVGHTNTQVLNDGKVYILGICGVINRGEQYQFEVFDPQTNEFKIICSDLIRSKEDCFYNLDKTIALENDKIVLFGSNAKHGHNFNQVDIYDYKTSKITNIGSMNIKDRSSFGTTLLKDGNLLITGGNTGYTTTLKETNSVEILNTKIFKFYPLPKMKTNYGSSVAILLNDGRVLITGGSKIGWKKNDNLNKAAELYIPKNIINNKGE